MDSFAKSPSSRSSPDVSLSLADVNSQVAALKAEYASKGIALSGRILHVAHYLPVQATLAPSKIGVLSPPLTPPVRPSDVGSLSFSEEAITAPAPQDITEGGDENGNEQRWLISPRWGHSAMYSGIQSLGAAAQEQVIVGWTGDLERGAASTGEKVKIPAASVSESDRAALVEAIETHKSEDGPIKYVPVFLDDDVAHGHYDGYCKTSAYMRRISPQAYHNITNKINL